MSAVVLAATILPLTGGPLKPHEVREFRAAFAAYLDGETSLPSLEPTYYPRAGRGAPVERNQARAPARVQHASLRIEDSAEEELALLELEGSETATLTNLDTTEAAATFEAPVAVCDADCEALTEEPDPFTEDEKGAEYGPVEDAAF